MEIIAIHAVWITAGACNEGEGMKLRASLASFSRSVELFLYDDPRSPGKIRMATGLIFEDVEQGMFTPPTTRLDLSEAQELMDDLWQCGLRPSEGTGSAGAMAATQKHLEDMRKIAFKYIDKG